MSKKILLHYFKPSGKYYSGGEFETEAVNFYALTEEVRTMFEARCLPELIDGAQFTTLLMLPDGVYEQSYPFMLTAYERTRRAIDDVEQTLRGTYDSDLLLEKKRLLYELVGIPTALLKPSRDRATAEVVQNALLEMTCGHCRGDGTETRVDGVGGKWPEQCSQCHGRKTVTVMAVTQ